MIFFSVNFMDINGSSFHTDYCSKAVAVGDGCSGVTNSHGGVPESRRGLLVTEDDISWSLKMTSLCPSNPIHT